MNWNLPNPHLRKTRKNKGTKRLTYAMSPSLFK